MMTDSALLKILIDFDVDKAHQFTPQLHREGVIAGMHKCRVYAVNVPRALREESLAWLKANGYTGLHGDPLPEAIHDD